MQHLMLNIAFSRGTACGVKSRAHLPRGVNR